MDLNIRGRTAVISGAAGDISVETARILLADGARLILTDIDEDELREAAEKLDGGESVRTVVADLSEQSGADKVREDGTRGEDEWTPTLMFHAAGVTGAKGDPLDDITEEDWSHAWNTDFMTAVRMSKAFIPAMRKKGFGRVVFVTSENVAQPYPDEVVYNASKAAVLSFAKGMSQVYAQQGVLINCIAPAFIETDMTDGMMEKRAKKEGTSKEEAIESFIEEERPHLELERRGRPEEVAFIAAALLSERASFVNGSNYRIDGGSVQTINVVSDPFDRAAIVRRVEAHPVGGDPAAMRAAFAELVLGDADGTVPPRMLGAPVLAGGDGLSVLPHVDPAATGGAERYAPDRLIVWFHGGGYVFGSPETHLRPAARVATLTGTPVLLPRYPLTPEHRWPAQLDHALDVARRAIEGGARSVLAGDSAGGHLALVTALELARRGTPASGLLLFSPNTDRTGLSDTRERMTPLDPMNSDEDDRRLARMCFGAMPDDHPHVSPVLDDLTLLPPTHIEVGDPEVLLGDSLILHGRARTAGADATLHVEPGLLHMAQLWVPWWPAAEASLARAAARAGGWLQAEGSDRPSGGGNSIRR